MIAYFKKSVFAKIGLLFLTATFALIFSSYYLFDWSFTGSDNLLDAHDAYYNFKLVDSWGNPPDTSSLSLELKNLHVNAAIFVADGDTLCENDTLIYWSNFKHPVFLCDYLSYTDSEILENRHKINFPAYVSFGEVEINSSFNQATLVAHNNLIYLLVVDFLYPNRDLNVVPLVFLSIVFMLFLYLLVRRFLFPINLIEKRIKSLEAGDLESKIKVLGSDELAMLSKNFNQLVEDVRGLLQQKERLLSDVSHELRSPLAKIQLALAMIPKHKKVEDVEKQIKLLDSLITNILLSDKMASPYSNLKIAKIKISSLFKDALELTFVKNIKINNYIDHLLSIDGVKMSIALKNLIENAHKYAKTEEPIEIFVSDGAGFVFIEVKDRGPGIPEDQMEIITKAFVRGKHKKTSGFGLGLSICYKIMAAHKGELKIKNNIKGGASFTLCVPKK